MKKPKESYVGVHMPRDLREAVARLAKENGRSLAAEMRMAAQRHVAASGADK